MTLGSQGAPVCAATDDVIEWKEEGGVIKWSCWRLVIYQLEHLPREVEGGKFGMTWHMLAWQLPLILGLPGGWGMPAGKVML